MSDTVWIAGVGMTRFGVHRDRSVRELAREAVTDALADAGLESGHLDAAVFGNTSQGILEGQHSIRGEVVLRSMGIGGIPVLNVENACATGSSALHTAVSYVRSGMADVALAVGAEKMNVDEPGAREKLFTSGYDVAHPEMLEQALIDLGGEVDNSDVGRRSIFMDIYAAMARNHMERHGTTARDFATVASKNHAHSVLNERAHYRRAMSPDDVLAGRRLSFPLTVPMCAPITDGGAAVIVCNEAGARRLGRTPSVRVLGIGIGTGTDREPGRTREYITARLAATVYERAGVGPEDIAVAEVHDATAVGEVIQTEALGLVPVGEGGRAAALGETTLGGRIPVNPSGGLESKGHPLGATGLGQVFELTQQLRGQAGDRQVPGARIALAENGGGFHQGEEAVAVITVLGS